MRIRQLLAASALTLGAVAVPAAVATTPAQAGPPPLCFKEYDLMVFPSSVRAYGHHTCEDGVPVPLFVALERYDAASGVWRRVAEGSGEARFNCFGTGQRKYRHAQKRDLVVTAKCT